MFRELSDQLDTAILHTMDELYDLWGIWNLRVIILVSFSQQIILTICSPFRKWTSKSCAIQPIVWAFLLADSTTKIAVGLFSSPSSTTASTSSSSVHPYIQTLWSCFLLLHLGGPDPIVASSLEDIKTNFRSIFILIIQALFFSCTGVLMIADENGLYTTSNMIFTAGCLKISERILSLSLAHPDSLRIDLLAKRDHDEDNRHHADPQLPTCARSIDIIGVSSNPDEELFTGFQVVVSAHDLFKAFKGLIVDLIPSSKVCRQSRDFFLKRSPRDAFEILAVELHCIHDNLYTKVNLMTTPGMHFFRVWAFIQICTALASFCRADKQEFQTCDVVITYILLIGAVSHGLLAILMLLFSDWMAVFLNGLARPQSPAWENVRTILLDVIKKIRWSSSYSNDKDPAALFPFGWLMQQNQFSQFLNQNNLIRLSLHPPPSWLRRYVLGGSPSPVKNLDASLETTKVISYLREVVFMKLKEKSEASLGYSSGISGDWIFKDSDCCSHVLGWFDDFEFDKALLVWHIATDLCCFETTSTCEGGQSVNGGDSLRTACKLLSEYMFYLLADENKMLSPIAGIYDLRIIYTCLELDGLFSLNKIPKIKPEKKNRGCLSTSSILCFCFRRCRKDPAEEDYDSIQKQVCKLILDDDDASLDPSEEKFSVLSDARKLATELMELGEEKKWVIMSKVWVEFLSYAALRCPGSSHAAKLCKGGEFLSLIWLLSAHFGLGKQYK